MTKPYCAIRGAKLSFPEPLRYVAFDGGVLPTVKKTGYMEADETIDLWNETDDGRIEVPRNTKVNPNLFVENGTKLIFSEAPIELKAGFKPYAHQTRILNEVNKEISSQDLTDFFIRMPCGGGKTVSLLMILAKLRLKALILCPTNQLVEQWEEAIEAFLDPSCELGEHIVVSTIHSAHKLGDDFDVVVADEAHTIAADQWGEAVQLFSSKFRIALTATPFRTDGTCERMFAIFGQRTFIVSEQELEDAGLWHRPSVVLALFRNDDPIKHAMKYGANGELVQYYSSARTYNALATNTDRQEFIASIVRKASSKGRISLTLFNRTKAITDLAERIAPLKPGIVRSKAKFDVELAKDHIVGISSMVTQGLDKKNLDTMIMGSPFSGKGVLEQMYGRLTRPFGNAGIFFDIVDTDLDADIFSDRELAKRQAGRRGRALTPLESSAMSRIAFYKSKGMTVSIMADGKFYGV